MARTNLIEQQKLYLSYLPEVRQKFGSLPNVQKIGLGVKKREGQLVDEWAFRFYVNRKVALGEIPNDGRIPSRIHGLPTDVLSLNNKLSLVTVSDAPVANNEEYRDQGIRGGISIRNQHFENDHPSGYGTLGVLARRKSDNALVALTCSHVANTASDSPTSLDTRIGQPKYYISCCCCPRGWIGDIKKATLNNDLDCALIEIDEDIRDKVISNNTENKVEGFLTDITGAALPLLHDTVKKYGRATGLTTGIIEDINFGPNHMLISLTGGSPGDAFAHHGDSGAVIVNEDNQVIGLLVAAFQETIAGVKQPLTKAIATLIKPVMQDLGITIAGVDAADVTFPVRAKPWPGGQTDTTLNPVETFTSADFGFMGNVDWDVSGAAAGAFIVETGSRTATGQSSISVRYDTVSNSKNKTDAVSIKATKGADSFEKLRTVFKVTPRINTNAVLDTNNTKRFNFNAGIDNQAGVAVPGTDGATWFMAKAEIIFDILPTDMQWDNNGVLSFVNGAAPGSKGEVIARRQTKLSKGQLVINEPSPTRTVELNWISAGDSSIDDFQEPTTLVPNAVFRLANEGLKDPNTLLQAYSRADYRDYLEIHDGTSWIRITPFAEWFVNLTADFNGPPCIATPPPNVGNPNTIGSGNTNVVIPTITYCGFVGDNVVITKSALVAQILQVTEGEHNNWQNNAGGRIQEVSALRFDDLVIYCLAFYVTDTDLIGQIQTEIRNFAGLTIHSDFTAVSNAISANVGGNGAVATRIRRALSDARNGALDNFPWSAVFISHCVRQAALDLAIEYVDNIGVTHGQDKILGRGRAHGQYGRLAFERTNDNTLGCYHAFETDRVIERGDIIIQDRRTCLIDPGPGNPCPPGQVVGIADIRDFNDLATQPATTHGDLVVDIDNVNNFVIAIGGNVGNSVRRRRFPINNDGTLAINNNPQHIYSQEQDNGNLGPTTTVNAVALQRGSTSRVFAILGLVEEEETW